ncbi:MAG: DUF1015 domain-containing protein [Dehalococcoidia bacterium]
MADFRPFRGLRYDPSAVGDIGSVLAPPFDVIDAEEQAALHERSPYNVVRLELSEQRQDDNGRSNRYTRAASTLDAWRRAGVIAQEDEPSFYVYTQEFEFEGARRKRTAVFGRLRVEPWPAGSVRPHEETMAKPKEDRLQLLRHLRVNVSPVFVTARKLDVPATGAPLFDSRTPDGQRYTLAAVRDRNAIEAFTSALRDEPFYILDGHHRFETALAYRDERKARAREWTGEEPENFALAAITAADDPGLALLPIHRLVRPPVLPSDLIPRLQRYFDVDDVTPKSYDGTALLRLLARVTASGASGTAFGAIGLEEGRLHLLTLRDGAAARALMPERSASWQALDVSVLEYAVLRETLGVDTTGDAIAYTEDAQRAHREVEGGRWPLAFLLNPTRIEEMLAVADAGERMPAKSTFFYPKLATGAVLNPLD